MISKQYISKLWILLAIILAGVSFAFVYGTGTDGTRTYASDEDNFTFPYPADFITFTHPVADAGKRIVLESTKAERGFEITILPFDEPGPLTAERILVDIPDMTLENSHSITIGSGIPALAFDSADENIGPTHEIWFPYDGFLYQARTRPAFGPEMEMLLAEWSFK